MVMNVENEGQDSVPITFVAPSSVRQVLNP